MKVLLRQIACIIFVFLSLPVSAQVYAEQMLTIGRNVLAMDDYVLAIQYFNHASASKPYLWDPYYYRALAKLMLDDYNGAEADASLAIDINKFKYEAYRVRGFARMKLGCDSAAVSDFNAGLEYSPADKYFLYYKGVAQASMGSYDSADSTLSELIRLYPRFEDAYGSRAQAHLLASDTVGALADVEAALRINTNMIMPRLMRADVALRQHRWSEAAAELDTVINLSPADVSLYINRAYARYNADDWPGAMADYNYALDLEPANYAALYNRALLRFQVQDLQGAAIDFSKVLEQDPDDFPARYNRGLVNLDLGKYRAALADFTMIAGRYPRFYPVYYAISRAQQGLGNNKAAADNFFKANDLITRYTANPAQYQLDRPTIQSGATRERDAVATAGGDDEASVMEHFNELVTVSQQDRATPLFGEKLRGRVQDVDMRVQPEEAFSLTFFDPTDELRPRSETFAELTEINAAGWLEDKLFLASGSVTPADTEKIQQLFDKVERISAAGDVLRPIDRLARAVAYVALRNYEAAVTDLEAALEENPDFVSALLERAYLLQVMHHEQADNTAAEPSKRLDLEQAMADYDAALKLDPRLAYAWMGKGCVLYSAGDYAGAAGCFSQAIDLSAGLGQAYYNRALCMLRLGRKPQAIKDLSRAGELGVVAAYNLLKKV